MAFLPHALEHTPLGQHRCVTIPQKQPQVHNRPQHPPHQPR
eukprot:CAMPEP_0206272636 /NCGR_PEP_ID=MMETSP0047_2-20121206/34116_1 /ASSEMBLY_ACC=CAM_ASM_000192 /TAXON_ID=195065 /ORGANISM="Chroomonas mesostigmatica_cf, Strain CCMP1168" /LENGTH=40 /DNA_ID= /DNA_START= /DNA_END= /DNA_ORIENTATION=